MTKFKEYRRTKTTELRPVTEDDIFRYESGETGSSVILRHTSISDEDRKNGSPKIGDMIARNPKNHSDLWLVSEKYFNDNFEVIND